MQKSEIAIISILIERKEEWMAAIDKQNISKLESDWDKINIKIKTWIIIFYYNIVRKNSLIITSLSWLYLNFANIYYIGNSKRIK